MLVGCGVYLVWPDGGDVEKLKHALHAVQWMPYLPIYLGLQAVVHVCRSLRWNNLQFAHSSACACTTGRSPALRISSVGFMAILALPVRLGEFVRPGLIRKHGVSATGALGTVAVERIVDGRLALILAARVRLLLPAARARCAGLDDADRVHRARRVLGIALRVPQVFAMWRRVPTVKFCMRLTLLPRFAPRIAVAR